jgi:hypothetical protein
MQVFRRKKWSKKVFFVVVAISEMVGDDDTAVDLSSKMVGDDDTAVEMIIMSSRCSNILYSLW